MQATDVVRSGKKRNYFLTKPIAFVGSESDCKIPWALASALAGNKTLIFPNECLHRFVNRKLPYDAVPLSFGFTVDQVYKAISSLGVLRLELIPHTRAAPVTVERQTPLDAPV
jgi:hypothetical protein